MFLDHASRLATLAPQHEGLAGDRSYNHSALALAIPASEIAHIINADLRPHFVPDRLIARDIGPAQNGHLAIEGLARLERLERRPLEKGAHGAAAVGLGNAGRYADIFIAVL